MTNNHLIIFTRYPIPGTTKTRLIPALGENGAADLQRELTEHTLNRVKGLTADISVYFSGGSLGQMQGWLGYKWQYVRQTGETLGDRLIHAMTQSQQKGYARTVIIGIDCPGITTEILTEAFTALEEKDTVFGEAADGGYYLVGLQRLVPEIFTDMSWGTETVLAETLTKTEALDLETELLQTLNDIDYPEDLEVWEQIKIAKNAPNNITENVA